MDELFSAIFGIGCFLTFVALAVHVVWLVAGKLYGALTGRALPRPSPIQGAVDRLQVGLMQSPTPVSSLAVTCPRCATRMPDRKSGCPICGWPQTFSKAEASQRALRALERQLERYHLAGIFDVATYLRLTEGLRTEANKSEEVVLALAPERAALPVVDPVEGGLSLAPLDTEMVIAEAVEEPPVTNKIPEAPFKLWTSDAATPAARVEEFMRRQKEPVVAAPSQPEPVSATRPAQWFSAFLEERHIRWGELVGGLLIVCCSIALVLSFWSRIAEMPVLKFLVFNGVTAALFGLGFYSSQRWKLPTTSHGLFLIATLLVPLNFLAIAAFTQQSNAITPLTIIGEVLSIALFGFLIYRSGGAIVAVPAALVIGVLGPSISHLLMRHFVRPGLSTVEVAALAAVPTVCYLAAAGWSLARARRSALTPSNANALFTLLGVVSLATLLPLGLLLVRSEQVALTLHRLAPLAPLLGGPYLACGLLIWQRGAAKEFVQVRTAGTAIAVLGSLVMLMGIGLAWPGAIGMLLAAGVSAILFTIIAIYGRIPAAHVPGLACATLAWLLAAALVRGDITWQLDDAGRMVSALLSVASGISLAPLVALLALATWQLRRMGRALDGRFVDGAALSIAAVSLLVVSWHGLGRVSANGNVTWLYAGYAAAALLAALGGRGRQLAVTGAALTLVALIQGLAFDYATSLDLAHPWTTALLAHATMIALLAALTSVRDVEARAGLRDAWAGCAVATSVLAAGILGWHVSQAPSWWLAAQLLWLASVWLVVAWHYASPLLMAGVQTAMALAVGFAVASALQTKPWFIESRLPWFDPWSIQAVGVALALLVLVWSIVRIGLLHRANRPASEAEQPERHQEWRKQINRLFGLPAAQVDRWLLILLMLAATGLATYGAMPGVAQELTPRRRAVQLAAASASAPVDRAARVVPPLSAFEVRGIPHEHALQWGSWLLVGTLASVLLVRQWERFNAWRVLGLVLLASLACPLLAGMLESQVAAASALRWLTALFLAAISTTIWLRRSVLRGARTLGWPDMESALPPLRRDALVLSLLLLALPLTAMGAYTALTAVWTSPIDPTLHSTWNSMAMLFMIGAAVGLLLGAAGRLFSHSAENFPGWQTWLTQAGLMTLILGAGPMVVVSLYAVSTALRGNPVVGPEPGTFFASIGLAASYALPVAVIALTLIGHAIRERSSAFAFAAGLLLNVSATAGWLLLPRVGGLQFDAVLWVKLAQLNLVVTALYAIAWLAATSGRLRRSASDPSAVDPFLATQVALAVALTALLFVPSSLMLWFDPLPLPIHEQLGQPLGWCAVLTMVVALGWLRLRRDGHLPAVTVSLATLAVGATVCFTLAPQDSGNWLTWHGLLITLVASAWVAPAVAWWRARSGANIVSSSTAAMAWSVLLAFTVVVWSVRSGWSDPQRPWWSLGSLAAIGLLSSLLACWRGRRRYLAFAALLINLAVTIGWLNLATLPNQPSGMLVELLAVQAIALTLPALAWLMLDLRVLRKRDSEERSPNRMAIHWLTAAGGVLMVAGLAALGVWGDLNRELIEARLWLYWLALASTTLAVVACLWDERVKTAVAGLYLLGLAAIGITLDQFNLSPDWLVWTGTMIVAAYTLATSYLWSRRDGLLAFGDAVRIPRSDAAGFAGLGWLLTANGVLIASVLAIATWVDFTFAEQSLRLLTGKAAIVQALAVGLLARGRRRSDLQWAALSIGVLGAILWGWAWLEPDMSAVALHRLVVVAMTLAGMSALYGIGLVKLLRRENEWTRAAKELVPLLIALTGLSIALVLAWEIVLQATTGAVPMTWPAMVAVAAALITVTMAALAAAVLPGRDPLGMSERGRTAYVYAAEAVLALLFVHIRLTMPELFSGFFQQYWPFLAMLLAFVGVAVSEWFRRRQQNVLAEPLENTAALLPMLPVLGFWATPVEGHYSMLLIAVGAMYATLSTLKRSFGFGLLSALALNGALWYVLYDADGLGLAQHPQLWLIPPALCVLAAAYLNRDRLSDSQMTHLRYLCSTVIYVSSTADMFLVGVAHAPWLPLVLAGLSVAGIFLGIQLRVRGFLLLGASFLILALTTMIWHAAWNLQQTWVWSVSGIVAGMLIIALFAVFEKKRQEVLRLVDQLKEWEA